MDLGAALQVASTAMSFAQGAVNVLGATSGNDILAGSQQMINSVRQTSQTSSNLLHQQNQDRIQEMKAQASQTRANANLINATARMKFVNDVNEQMSVSNAQIDNAINIAQKGIATQGMTPLFNGGKV